MSFESRVVAFAERFLSARTFELIVAPALADLQFEHDAGSLRRRANQLAVFRAVTGGLRDDLARQCGDFFRLTLLTAGYHIFLMLVCFDVLSISVSIEFIVMATLILVLSLAPVLVCFWPERQAARPSD